MEPFQEPLSSAATISTLQIAPLPPSSLYDSLDDLIEAVQQHQRSNGAAIVKKSPSNYRIFEGEIEARPSYYTLVCDRGCRRPSESTGLRKTSTQKRDCPFRLIASATKQQGWKWFYRVAAEHNHEPSIDPSAHAIHRRRTMDQQDLELSMLQYQGLPAREMAQVLRDSSPSDNAFFRNRDIYNDRQQLRTQGLGGLSSTQAWLKILRDEGIKHQVDYDAYNRVRAIVWTYPWCEEMWRAFPEALGLDNTYKTNRFNMYLFQVTGMTDQMSVVNLAYGLSSAEDEESYFWLASQLEALRAEINAESPRVIMTDKEDGLRNALQRVFPEAQQQLCVYHINANIRKMIRRHWRPSADDPNPDESADELSSPIDADFLAAQRAEATADSITVRLSNPTPEMTPDAMFEAWQRVIYADTEADFEEAWQTMIDAYDVQQGQVLRYINNQWLPWRHQWARCYITHYRNFGLRVNSPTETAHRALKSFSLTSQATLLQLHEAIVQLLEHKRRIYREKAAEAGVRQLNTYRNQLWLGDLPLLISRPALSLVWKQGLWARAANPDRQQPYDLGYCTERFSNQYGLPCSHRIFEVIAANEALQKEEIHPRWWLRKPLDYEVELRRIRDPAVVMRLRGRPRLARNAKETVPESLVPPSSLILTHRTSAASTPVPSSQLRVPQSQTNRADHRYLPANIRRYEAIDELDRTPPQPAKRARSSVRGTRGTRGRGRGGSRVAASRAAASIDPGCIQVDVDS